MKWKCPKCSTLNEEVAGICGSCCTLRPPEVALLPDEALPSSTISRGAGFGIRFAARLIDLIIGLVLGLVVGAITGVVFYILVARGLMEPGWQTRIGHFSALGFLVGLIGAWMYHTLSEGIASASIGKLLCGLRVITLEGRPISLPEAFKRGLAYHWDALFFGLVAYDSMKKSPLCQRYGDVWAKTIVVKQKDFAPTPARTATTITLGILAALCAWSLAIGLELYIKTH